MLKMKQAAEQVLTMAEQKGLKDVDVVVERNESLDVEICDGKVEKVGQSLKTYPNKRSSTVF